MPAVWTNELKTGVYEIDMQHKEIFRRIQALVEACKRGEAKGRLRETIVFLEEYVSTHFYTEEVIQKEHNFPGFTQHKLAHMEYLKNFVDLKKRFKKEGATISLTIKANHLILEGLVNHIMSYDKEMAKFLQERGVGENRERVIVQFNAA